VVYGLRNLLVEVVPGVCLRGVVLGLVDGWGRGVFLYFNPGPSRRIFTPALNSLSTLYTTADGVSLAEVEPRDPQLHVGLPNVAKTLRPATA
jgi:hypothetical protein